MQRGHRAGLLLRRDLVFALGNEVAGFRKAHQPKAQTMKSSKMTMSDYARMNEEGRTSERAGAACIAKMATRTCTSHPHVHQHISLQVLHNLRICSCSASKLSERSVPPCATASSMSPLFAAVLFAPLAAVAVVLRVIRHMRHHRSVVSRNSSTVCRSTRQRRTRCHGVEKQASAWGGRSAPAGCCLSAAAPGRRTGLSAAF